MKNKDINYQSVLDFIKRNYLSEKYVTRAINQIVIVLAIMVALRANPPRPLQIIIVLIVTIVIIQITRVYAGIIGHKIKYKQESVGVTRRELIRELKELIGDFYKGLLIPIFFLALSGLRLISVSTAFLISSNILLVVLFVYGYLAGRQSGNNIFMSLIYGLGILLIVSVMVYIRTLT